MESLPSYATSTALLAERYRDTGLTKIVGTEARGFLFGSYALEYGTDSLEIHQDAIVLGDKVLVVDDLLATGGTIGATVKLIRRLGGEVQDATFVINLANLGGEALPNSIAVANYSLVLFPGH